MKNTFVDEVSAYDIDRGADFPDCFFFCNVVNVFAINCHIFVNNKFSMKIGIFYNDTKGLKYGKLKCAEHNR